MKIKRLISMLVAMALVTMSLTTIGVSAKTVTDSTTLRWDFESTDDFAPLDKSGNFGYLSTNPDTIGSGAWSRQIVDEWPANGAPFQTTFDRIYTANGESNNDVNPWPYIDPSATSPAFTSQPLEGGGNYCAVVNSSTGTAGRTVGMCIMLSDTEFVPGHTYKVSADLFSAAADRMVYMGLSKPSDRTSKSTASNPSWMTTEGKRAALSTVNDPANPKENGCAGNDAWRKGEGFITPTVDMYENGKILFYIGGGDLGDSHSQLPKNECLYIDNVEITPQHAFAGYSSLKRGRIWDFEEKSTSFTDFVGEFDENNAAKDVVNKWGAVVRGRDKNLARHPKYITVADANARLYGMWEGTGLPEATDNTGYAGTPAPGSSECVYVHAGDGKTKTWFNEDSNASALGMRLVISEDEFPAGTYNLSFYGASTRNNTSVSSAVSAAETWKIAVIPTDHVGFNDMSLDKGTLSASLANAAVTLDTGVRNGSFWSYVNATITLTEDCYYNGTTSIILYNNAPNGCYTSEAVYFDEITLAPVDDGGYIVPNDGSAVNGYLTTMIAGAPENPVAYVAAYDTDDNGNVILTDIDAFAAKAGITNHQFSVVPSNNPWGWPYIKSFLLDNDLAPITSPIVIGE